MSRPMVYFERSDNYMCQNVITKHRRFTDRQIRQMERMAHRESYRERGELTWTAPPAPHARGRRHPELPELVGSLATHVVRILPGQKTKHGKRIPRTELETP